MTPAELVNAIQRVTPGKDPPAQCHGWRITARIVPEQEQVEYTASIAINLHFRVNQAAFEFPMMLAKEFEIHAEDIVEADTGIKSLLDEMSREARKRDYGEPDSDSEH